MQKLLNSEIKKYLIKYHKVFGDENLGDDLRDRKLSFIRKKLRLYDIEEIKGTALALSKSKKRALLFRMWCELIVLTGEV